METKRNVLFRWGFLAAALLVVMQARAVTFQIDVFTDALGLDGRNWDLAFDFTDADGIPPVGNPHSNSVTISNFSITNGKLVRPSPPIPPYPRIQGDVTGDLATAPPPVVLLDSAFSEYLDNANLGTLLTFVLSITEKTVQGSFPDAFAFFILYPDSGLPIETSDPTGVLFVYNVGDNQPVPFCPDEVECLRFTPVVLAVPEPGALVLAVVGLLALGVVRAGRKLGA